MIHRIWLSVWDVSPCQTFSSYSNSLHITLLLLHITWFCFVLLVKFLHVVTCQPKHTARQNTTPNEILKSVWNGKRYARVFICLRCAILSSFAEIPCLPSRLKWAKATGWLKKFWDMLRDMSRYLIYMYCQIPIYFVDLKCIYIPTVRTWKSLTVPNCSTRGSTRF